MSRDRLLRAVLASTNVRPCHFGTLTWRDQMVEFEYAMRRASSPTNEKLERLDSHFAKYVHALGDRLDTSIGEIADIAFEGFADISGLLRDQVKIQTEVHKELCTISFYSEQIAQAALESRRTKINEIFYHAINLSSDGLFQEALHEFDKCLAEYEYDFLVHYRKGWIFLYGVSEEQNVVDLKKGSESFALARKYGRRAHDRIRDGRFIWSAILLESAKCHYQLANDAKNHGDWENSALELEKALEFINESSDAPARFVKIQILAAQGRNTDTLHELKTLIEEDRAYYYKALDLHLIEIEQQILALREELLSTGKSVVFNEILQNAKYLCKLAADDVDFDDLSATIHPVNKLAAGWNEFRGKPTVTIKELQVLTKRLGESLLIRLQRSSTQCSHEVTELEKSAMPDEDACSPVGIEDTTNYSRLIPPAVIVFAFFVCAITYAIMANWIAGIIWFFVGAIICVLLVRAKKADRQKEEERLRIYQARLRRLKHERNASLSRVREKLEIIKTRMNHCKKILDSPRLRLVL
jgi:tetratricopeptide (TPR) repeat protein